jgi:hypothetical protein
VFVRVLSRPVIAFCFREAQLFSGLFGGGLSLIPMILALVALVDCVRVGASWYWLWIILGFPVLGPLAYFVVVRSAALGDMQSSFVSPYVARRLQARRRLRQLQVQLAHWRGPGLLIEAGEELLVLGRFAEAESHFREAQQNGAVVEDVNYGLTWSLVMQGRWAEAVPLLEALISVEPDSHLGEGPMLLARCLDECGGGEGAEAALRKVLEKRTVIEAQVRLARILYQRGQKEEADKLVAEILLDARILPRYLKRRHRAWLRAARGLSAHSRLPRPRIEGSFAPGEQLRLILIAAAGVVLALLIAGFWMSR